MAKVSEQSSKASVLLGRLDALKGEWNVIASSMSFRANKSDSVKGTAIFKWMDQGPFITLRSEFPDSEFPPAIWVIGPDDMNEKYCALYADSRGVARIYEMALNADTWKMWRTSSDFSQRFTGTISDDGNTITSYWEKSEDGSNWERDVDMVYKRAR